MMVRALSVKSKDINEDLFYYNDKLFFVFDGATPLSKKSVGIDLIEMLEDLKQLIINDYNRGNFNTQTIENKLFEYSEIFKGHLKNFHHPYEVPSICLGIALIENNNLNIYILGDILCLVKLKNNEVLIINDERLNNIDIDSINKISEGQNKLTVLRNARNSLNVKYCVFSPINYNKHFDLIKRVIPLNKIDKFSLSSDGYYEYIEGFNISSRLNIIDLNIYHTTRKIINKCNEDYDLKHFLRFKNRDDITSLLVKIENHSA